MHNGNGNGNGGDAEPQVGHVNIGGLLPLVDYFDGKENEDVVAFLESVTRVGQMGNWNDNHKANVVYCRVRGEARDFVRGEAELNTADFNKLREALIARYAVKEGIVARQQRFLDCSQRPAETVKQFATRLKIVGGQTIDSKPGDAGYQFDEINLKASLLAVFLKGIKEELRLVTRAHQPNTLEEALSFASDMEESRLCSSKRVTIGAMRDSSINCQNCGQPGHSFDSCPRVVCFKCNRQGHFMVACPNTSNYKSKPANPTKCFNCGKLGHISRECRAPRQQRQQSQRTEYLPQPPPPPQQQPTQLQPPQFPTTQFYPFQQPYAFQPSSQQAIPGFNQPPPFPQFFHPPQYPPQIRPSQVSQPNLNNNRSAMNP